MENKLCAVSLITQPLSEYRSTRTACEDEGPVKSLLNLITSNIHSNTHLHVPFLIITFKVFFSADRHAHSTHTQRAHSTGISGGQLPTSAQWNAFGRLMGHPPAAE